MSTPSRTVCDRSGLIRTSPVDGAGGPRNPEAPPGRGAGPDLVARRCGLRNDPVVPHEIRGARLPAGSS